MSLIKKEYRVVWKFEGFEERFALMESEETATKFLESKWWKSRHDPDCADLKYGRVESRLVGEWK
jgi:hypothetical protein